MVRYRNKEFDIPHTPPEYTIWKRIRVYYMFDPTWVDSYETFLEDMGERPTPKHRLVKLNFRMAYCKQNCRWMTDAQHREYKRKEAEATAEKRTYKGRRTRQDNGTYIYELVDEKENSIIKHTKSTH